MQNASIVGGRFEEKRLSPHDLRKVLPRIVAAQQSAVESAEQKVGAAGPDLSVAIETRRRVCAGRKLDPKYDAGRHVLEEARVHAHDLDVADVFGIEGRIPSDAPVSVVRVRLTVGTRTMTPQSRLKL